MTGQNTNAPRDATNPNGYRKLQIGCGWNILDGWLNVDYRPVSSAVAFMDAVKPFPFSDGSFDFIYSEHMIEHISFPEARMMLNECYRVLKKDGRIRLSTPDFGFLLKLYNESEDDLNKGYIRWATEQFVPYSPSASAIYVVNNYVRDWGHKFIYDENALKELLISCGFARVERGSIGLSQVKEFVGLENEGRLPEGFVALESLIMEATK